MITLEGCIPIPYIYLLKTDKDNIYFSEGAIEEEQRKKHFIFLSHGLDWQDEDNSWRCVFCLLSNETFKKWKCFDMKLNAKSKKMNTLSAADNLIPSSSNWEKLFIRRQTWWRKRPASTRVNSTGKLTLVILFIISICTVAARGCIAFNAHQKNNIIWSSDMLKINVFYS